MMKYQIGIFLMLMAFLLSCNNTENNTRQDNESETPEKTARTFLSLIANADFDKAMKLAGDDALESLEQYSELLDDNAAGIDINITDMKCTDNNGSSTCNYLMNGAGCEIVLRKENARWKVIGFPVIPDIYAGKFLQTIFECDFEQAEDLSTGDALSAVEQLKTLFEKEEEECEPSSITISGMRCDISQNKAICSFILDGEDGSIQLIKKSDLWKVSDFPTELMIANDSLDESESLPEE